MPQPAKNNWGVAPSCLPFTFLGISLLRLYALWNISKETSNHRHHISIFDISVPVCAVFHVLADLCQTYQCRHNNATTTATDDKFSDASSFSTPNYTDNKIEEEEEEEEEEKKDSVTLLLSTHDPASQQKPKPPLKNNLNPLFLLHLPTSFLANRKPSIEILSAACILRTIYDPQNTCDPWFKWNSLFAGCFVFAAQMYSREMRSAMGGGSMSVNLEDFAVGFLGVWIAFLA